MLRSRPRRETPEVTGNDESEEEGTNNKGLQSRRRHRSRIVHPSWKFVRILISAAFLACIVSWWGMLYNLSIANPPFMQRKSVDNNKKNGRPSFIVHIGPHKTGTSFLQGTLCVQASDHVLAKENYYYLGTSMQHFLREDKLPFDLKESIFNLYPHVYAARKKHNETIPVPPALNDGFQRLLKELRAKNQSGILIHEELHLLPAELVEVLAKGLEKHGFQVIVVEGYRPMHQWLLSRFNQFLRDEYVNSVWPSKITDDGSEGFPPNIQFRVVTNTQYDQYTESLRQHNVSVFESTRNVWTQYFEDVRLVDMTALPPRTDGKDPMLMHFMCDIVPSAPNLCQDADFFARIADSRNPSSEGLLTYDKLTAWAWQMHLVDERLDRSEVKNAIMKHLVQNNVTRRSLPSLCPTPSEIESFWEWTRVTDERLFPHYYSRGSSSRSQLIWNIFQKDFHKNVFCSVDPSLLLNEEWKPVFQKLKESAS